MFWRRFLDRHPAYLARHYWWAYLWPPAVWLFDHETIVDAILFGHYKGLSSRVVRACTDAEANGPLLQLSCVHGMLTRSLLARRGEDVHIADVAEIQLNLARRKTRDIESAKVLAARMNAERLGYRDGAFGTVLIFFLLHELPPTARVNVLREAVRVLQPGGRLVVGDYAPRPRRHRLYRTFLTRWLLTRVEPFLEDFWKLDLEKLLCSETHALGKTIRQMHEELVFEGFYRLIRCTVSDDEHHADHG